MAFYTTTLSPGDFLPLFQLMDDYCDTRRAPSPTQSSRTKQQTPTHKPQLSFTPKFDVRESEKFYILDGELPGVQQENIEIEFTDPETMVIKGSVERNYDVTSDDNNNNNDDDVMSVHSDASSTHSNYHSPTVEDEDEYGVKVTSHNKAVVAEQQQKPAEAQPAPYKYWASERLIGNFQRSFSFSSRVNQDAVRATFKNGILSVVVPKETIQKAKRIRIE